ncbi:MAG: hypothetical protein JWO87_378 [Phycisphaerales bacterium]|nr:hypothetical protein [Phycisphaerales bacterium]
MELKEKIKFALDEARILILGGKVLIGFGYQSVVQPGFPKLPALSQYLLLGSLTLQLGGLALAMAPAARDCLFERGEASEGLLRYATRMIGCGLLPFAIGLGVGVYVAVRMLAGPAIGLVIGTAVMFLAMFTWYGARWVVPPSPERPDSEKGGKVELKDKIDHALTEARVVLPGAQAILGFQFIATLTDSFERLPSSFKYVHVVSLGLTALTVILLIAPAAFHRVVEHGEATERQHRVTTRFLLAAMVTLPPALTGDLVVVFWKVTRSLPLALWVSGGMLGFFYAVWFVPGLVLRAAEGGAGRQSERTGIDPSTGRGAHHPAR